MILVGDVRKTLATVEAGSVQCVVTSPPYWGLRDYGTATWDGGDADCSHQPPDPDKNGTKMTVGQKTSHAGRFAGPSCYWCGARRTDSQIGLEQTPEQYVAEMVAVFREVWRVLADDGVLWLNLGDSYARQAGPEESKYATKHTLSVGQRAVYDNNGIPAKRNVPPPGLKQKDLVGIPWRVAFALQADGWYLRQDIIWHKPNPMPESVTDRCTKSHEYLFMLTKSARYYFDNKAIAEPSAQLGATKIRFGGSKYGDSADPKHATKSGNEYVDSGTRNKRSVWTIPAKPFKGAHFAVMPEALVEPCILAASRPGDLVLDPFLGSGTVAVVATRNARRWLGCELNPAYAEIATNRINQTTEGLPL